MRQTFGNFQKNVKEHPSYLFVLSEFHKINFNVSFYFIVLHYKLVTVTSDVNIFIFRHEGCSENNSFNTHLKFSS